MALSSGDTLANGRYRIYGLLGQGGMGAVYQAEDTALSRTCAVKEMRPDPNATPAVVDELRAQFRREARVLANLSHPGLPRVTDYFSEGGNEYLIMDFVEGRSLYDIIKQGGGRGLPEQQVLAWAGQLLDALEYTHGKGILHRDIKPANVRLTPDGRVVLVDFGLVKLWDPTNPHTVMVMRGVGTPEYAPLEQYDTSVGHTDARSDLYSLGATLYHLLGGRLPPTATQRLIAPQNFVPLRQLNPEISPQTERAIFKALEVYPHNRFQSAAEMRQVLAHADAPAVPATGVPETSVAWPGAGVGWGPTVFPTGAAPAATPLYLGQSSVKRRRSAILGWVLIGAGGLSFLVGSALFLLFLMAQLASPDGMDQGLQGFLLVQVMCPVPVLMVGLVALVGGFVVLRRARAVQDERDVPAGQPHSGKRVAGWILAPTGSLLSFAGLWVLLLFTVAQLFSPEGPAQDISGYLGVTAMCPVPLLTLGVPLLVFGLVLLRRPRLR